MLLTITRRASLWPRRFTGGYKSLSTRTFTSRSSNSQQRTNTQAEVKLNRSTLHSEIPQHISSQSINLFNHGKSKSFDSQLGRTTGISASNSKQISIDIDGKVYDFSPLLLRDQCTCEKCLDPSSKQKNFLTVDIPAEIEATSVTKNGTGVRIQWGNDIPGFDATHVSNYEIGRLQSYTVNGMHKAPIKPPRRVLWEADTFSRNVEDIDYQMYMEDEAALHRALQQLHIYGLIFLVNVPDTAESVSRIAERIGPLKNTFYGFTWDVRSVPQAKNVAYTSKDLGFHMDLLYMHQPPHLQFLHCIRSSSLGGASLFTDSFRAVKDLHADDPRAFKQLVDHSVHFHYDHENHQYRRSRYVIELKDGNARFEELNTSTPGEESEIIDLIDAVAWSPPFQAPFSLPPRSVLTPSPQSTVGNSLQEWHSAATKFNDLIHRPGMIYDRLMGPGECVLFDNRRVLHARRAFEVGDAGKERWLRGAYVDKDPYESKMWVLQRKFGALDD
ncbi:gamma-butyrobetaine dioxygenase [Acrodontium crateriforme]|uniref:Gamma-butyrobetaine dioxygenase n=1 Tax=Acrodontium crateriforme TaxID=150365 RepID=A0AAQ3LZH0_9PEZI|nr:gamma-butyrobetaine dioxygenase [Acrodontium crateriforme]